MKITIELTPEEVVLVEKIRALAQYEQYCEEDGFCPGDSGNHDDDYENGVHDGEIRTAKEVNSLFDKISLTIAASNN